MARTSQVSLTFVWVAIVYMTLVFTMLGWRNGCPPLHVFDLMDETGNLDLPVTLAKPVSRYRFQLTNYRGINTINDVDVTAVTFIETTGTMVRASMKIVSGTFNMAQTLRGSGYLYQCVADPAPEDGVANRVETEDTIYEIDFGSPVSAFHIRTNQD